MATGDATATGDVTATAECRWDGDAATGRRGAVRGLARGDGGMTATGDAMAMGRDARRGARGARRRRDGDDDGDTSGSGQGEEEG
uniref:Uncharacterized protein n=1 Tax=Oryza sativa subsp. japonica TaxID=39947 RepID=Q6Z450_ORYSJ|nr:hypothetical protein [Oryza sativa Japonica Group]